VMGVFFATVMIILDFCASCAYFCEGDYRKFVYWLSAGILTISVTY